jgi:two-component system, OmpR family, response regulator ChvI
LSSVVDDDELMLNDFPIIGSRSSNVSATYGPVANASEVSFSGERMKYCVCFIDMVNSTVISSSLTGSQIARYYSMFLNSMSTIAKNFGARIVKNAGDCLIYYFPLTADTMDGSSFADVLDCCTTMIEAHRIINASLNTEGLPALNYRISADYGMTEIAKSSTSANEDLFGSTMNRCAKINSKARENGIAIGKELFEIVSSFVSLREEYSFEEVPSNIAGAVQTYPIFSVQRKQKRIILNPFKHMPKRLSSPVALGSLAANKNIEKGQ